MSVPGGTISSIRSRTSSERTTSTPASRSSSCSIVRAPSSALVTPGCEIANAIARWGIDSPAASASGINRSTDRLEPAFQILLARAVDVGHARVSDVYRPGSPHGHRPPLPAGPRRATELQSAHDATVHGGTSRGEPVGAPGAGLRNANHDGQV